MGVRAIKEQGGEMNRMNKMQVDVFVIVKPSLGEVQKSIKKYIDMGWQLQGAVTPVYVQGEVSYIATMVRSV